MRGGQNQSMRTRNGATGKSIDFVVGMIMGLDTNHLRLKASNWHAVNYEDKREVDIIEGWEKAAFCKIEVNYPTKSK